MEVFRYHSHVVFFSVQSISVFKFAYRRIYGQHPDVFIEILVIAGICGEAFQQIIQNVNNLFVNDTVKKGDNEYEKVEFKDLLSLQFDYDGDGVLLITEENYLRLKMAVDLKALFDKMCEKSEGIDNSEFVYIEHADCEADALTLKQKIEEHFGYKNIVINEMSPIIGAHVGNAGKTHSHHRHGRLSCAHI